ncbi:MAG: tRNA (adenosine(37)-N6)-threonylcarbamoyltransferase complex dimerization subunit type 1 TsaB [Melioribacteraceae bacterium]|nr:tRNA (adenosine(37)-N6)-threonylcarbamoyltransferase complex dimerization subunit type 1 TsaB [Melioribacteraceae bacterium]
MIQEKSQLNIMNNYFPYLAIETSAKVCSTALLINEKEYYELNFNKAHIHSEKIIYCIDELLKKAEIDKKELKVIAVSKGPGSFTGLRIGLATAKALSQALDIPLVPVPTFHAMALYISNFLNEGEQFFIITKANLGEYYSAKFISKSNSYEILNEVTIIKDEELIEIKKQNKIFGGYSGNYENPTAISIAWWAYFYGKDLLTSDIDYLEPEYIKKFVVKVKK